MDTQPSPPHKAPHSTQRDEPAEESCDSVFRLERITLAYGPPGSSRRDTWVDHRGDVHERQPGSHERVSRCGQTRGPNNPAPPARACHERVDAYLRAYAATHDCRTSRCLHRTTDDGPR
ncbi:hypothetical protein FHX42_002560 [Saccharopolyspora lacisalsi]|uniref:Uncharacterized protein n=1 Tax=Halosaccharopolyspora lacisalsi TaxID=1000566 RepID=A0A839DWS4_9PSEU|nr:hypothetical protein [Halosaccharopolyspora lacisalsi]MBA8825209.1 hypothetical protein [Halosaccharopolyspora lacisalsi]